MELSILVAKVFTLYILAMGVGIATGKLSVNKMVGDLKASQGLSLVTGFFLLVIGALLVQYHNIWVKDWTVLITILAWGVLIKGFLFVACPQVLFSFKGIYRNMKPAFGILFIAVGLVLGYFLFLA
jgi:hypothetical protein